MDYFLFFSESDEENINLISPWKESKSTKDLLKQPRINCDEKNLPQTNNSAKGTIHNTKPNISLPSNTQEALCSPCRVSPRLSVRTEHGINLKPTDNSMSPRSRTRKRGTAVIDGKKSLVEQNQKAKTLTEDINVTEVKDEVARKSPAKLSASIRDENSPISDDLHLEKHVVPKLKKNSLGLYNHMSPSKVSWARRSLEQEQVKLNVDKAYSKLRSAKRSLDGDLNHLSNEEMTMGTQVNSINNKKSERLECLEKTNSPRVDGNNACESKLVSKHVSSANKNSKLTQDKVEISKEHVRTTHYSKHCKVTELDNTIGTTAKLKTVDDSKNALKCAHMVTKYTNRTDRRMNSPSSRSSQRIETLSTHKSSLETTPNVLQKQKSSKTAPNMLQKQESSKTTPNMLQKQESSKTTPNVLQKQESSKSTPNVLQKQESSKATPNVPRQQESPITCFSQKSMDEEVDLGFFMNSMELVKQRTLQRLASQKSRSSSLDSIDSNRGSINSTPSKWKNKHVNKGTPQKSERSSNRPTPKKRKITVKISPKKINLTSNGRKSSKVLGIAKVYEIETVKSSPSTRSGSYSSVSRIDKVNKKMEIDSPNRTRALSVGGMHTNMTRNDNKLIKGRKSCLQPTSALNKSHISKGKGEIDRSLHSPSPVFGKSPKYLKTLKSTCHISDTPTTKARLLNFETCDKKDEYNIDNSTSPESNGQDPYMFDSPKSGYTSVNSGRKRSWRKKQESNCKIQNSSGTKSTLKNKLKRLSIENNDSEVSSPSVSKVISKKELQFPEVSEERNILQDKLEQQVVPVNNVKERKTKNVSKTLVDRNQGMKDISNRKEHKQSKERFVAIKQLKAKDLTYLPEHEYTHMGESSPVQQIGIKKITQPHLDKSIENVTDSQLDKTDHKQQKDKDGLKEINNVQNDEVSLNWQTIETPSRTKTVKLNNSWSLISDRSLVKLLRSEGSESFHGFQLEDIQQGSMLGSDMSFHETNEIKLDEKSDQEWEINEDQLNTDQSDDVEQYIPCTFTSPGKRSDSSWDDPFDQFIDQHVNKSGVKSTSLTFSPSCRKKNLNKSPGLGRKSRIGGHGNTPQKRKAMCSTSSTCGSIEVPGSLHVLESISETMVTPSKRRRKLSRSRHVSKDDGIERVDDEIEFNHFSPQKLESFRSPLKNKVSEMILSSSPLISSTPQTRGTRISDVAKDFSHHLPALDSSINSSKSTNSQKEKAKQKHDKSSRRLSMRQSSGKDVK